MAKLEKQLKAWVEQGIIDEKQAARLCEYESQQSNSNGFLTGALILGAVIVGTGVISLIASNWSEIPDFVKLVGDFLILGALVPAIIRSREQKNHSQFEALLVFFAIFCLASIGLISQIFHSGGKLEHALLLWAVMISGIAFASKMVVLPAVWMISLMLSISMTVVDSRFFSHNPKAVISAIMMSIPLFAFSFTVASRAFFGNTAQIRAFRICTVLSLVGVLIGLQVLNGLAYFEIVPKTLIPGYLFALMTLYFIYENPEYKPLQKRLLSGGLALFIFSFHAPLLGIMNELMYSIFCLFILGITALFLASSKNRRPFNQILLIIGFQIIYLYLRAFGGLATTGFGLVCSGALLIVAAVIWNRNKEKVGTQIERWVG